MKKLFYDWKNLSGIYNLKLEREKCFFHNTAHPQVINNNTLIWKFSWYVSDMQRFVVVIEESNMSNMSVFFIQFTSWFGLIWISIYVSDSNIRYAVGTVYPVQSSTSLNWPAAP